MDEATQVDILGAPYLAENIELPDDDEGAVVATLISRAAPAATGRAVLHVHGFSDYFFQTGLADFYVEQGFDFYALDLRKHGRSLRPHQTPNFCRRLSDYFPELDEALRRMRERDRHDVVVVDAHSAGGLVAALWADRRRRAGVSVADALVLNSPWLDLAGSLWRRTATSRAVARLGQHQPYRIVPRAMTGLYVESLHNSARGEWDFDLTWKPPGSFPARAGWLRAVRQGHWLVHRGIDVGAPVLVLASTRSSYPQLWCEEVMSTDVVLDVEQIARWSSRLGALVTLARIDGAVHDVTLSRKDVREEAYAQIRRWLSAYIPPLSRS